MDIWSTVSAQIKYVSLHGALVRVVESQEQVATLGLVDSLEEQSVLEDLLETGKPPQRAGTVALHYLLATPFRYPPLQYGSRFGSRYEPSLFYGSLQIPTALAETAFYRFTFWLGMVTPPPSEKLVTQHTVFSASYETERGLQLQAPPFDEYQVQLTDPAQYSITQLLGQGMREDGVGAFEYISARDPDRGLNVALFGPESLSCSQPLSQQAWLCETAAELVCFSNAKSGALHHFPLEVFQVRGKFAQPVL